MLLTCTVRSIAHLLKPRGKAGPKVALLDIPAYIKNELGLHGMNFSTDLLAGASRADLERLRDRADKAGCACLLLLEPNALAMGTAAKAGPSMERAKRVVNAAHVLGCNAASISIDAADSDSAFETVTDAMKEVMETAEQLELYVLINPGKGLTADPERVTDLIKKIGGFRVGTLPDFDAAVAAPDPELYLRRLTPYASAVLATTHEFAEPAEDEPDPDAPGSLEDLAAMLMSAEAPVHTTYDLSPLLRAVASVGFEGTVAIDYRGGGDGTLGVIQSRDAIEACLQAMAE